MVSTDDSDTDLAPADIGAVLPGMSGAGVVETLPSLSAPLQVDDTSLTREHAAQIVAIGAAARRMGVKVDVSTALAGALSPDALRLAVLDAAAARDEVSATFSTAPTPTTAGVAIEPAGRRESPIVAEARRFATENINTRR